MRSRFPSDMMTLEERERNYMEGNCENSDVASKHRNSCNRCMDECMYIYIYILTIDVITNVAMCLMLHTCLEVLISFWTLFDGGG